MQNAQAMNDLLETSLRTPKAHVLKTTYDRLSRAQNIIHLTVMKIRLMPPATYL